MFRTLNSIDMMVLGALIFLMVFTAIKKSGTKQNAENYFMANHALKWWSVAGSIYGTNVSLSQIIGMLGIGYSIGFAQSHYEILAIPAILLLCYLFIPIYRKANLFTLSGFLEKRYGPLARLLYAVIILCIILILLVGGLYIGSRQLGLLFTTNAISYWQGILLIAMISCLLVFFGGMASVVAAENMITVLMVLAVITVGYCTLSQPEINGIGGLLQLDRSLPIADQKMHLYLPHHHPDLPWTGVFSGLLVLHGFFWTTNQFEVQRVLAARSNKDAILGAVAAGLLKLSIPFFSIASGVAAAYLFRYKYQLTTVQPDDAFLLLMQQVVPKGFGLVGLILAGFTAAIFSSIYSMLNSASTVFAIDIYRPYLNKQATDKELVMAGRLAVLGLCGLGVGLALVSFEPTSGGNFFLTLSKNTSYLKPGIVSAFLLGICWRKTTAQSAITVILLSPIIGLGVEFTYQLITNGSLNFLHRVFISFTVCLLIQFLMSVKHKTNGDLLVTNTLQVDVRPMMRWGLYIVITPIILLLFVITKIIEHHTAGWLAGISVLIVFILKWKHRKPFSNEKLFQSDLLYSGLLAAITVWILFYFW